MRWLTGVLSTLFAVSLCAADQTVIRMISHTSWGIPPTDAVEPASQVRRAVFERFHELNPDIRVENAAGLEVAGTQPDAPFLMSMAGDTSPDIFYVNFRQMTNYIEQGFCRPLDDLISTSPGVLDRVKPRIREVLRSYDGKVYCIPFIQYGMALYYRVDFFREVGLDPDKPPRDWKQFYEYCQKLTNSKKGRYGFLFNGGVEGKSWNWINLLRQAGGEPVERTKSGFWRASFATEEGVKALEFFRKLTLEKWQQGGQMVGPAAGISTDWRGDIDRGSAAMWFDYTNDILLSTSRMNPALIGVAAMPEGPGGRANEINAGMWAISAKVKDPKKLEACWRFILFFSGDEAARIATTAYVENGMGNLVSPDLLQKFGHSDIVSSVDPLLVEANKLLFENGKPEPYGRNCQMLYVLMDQPIEKAIRDPNTDAMQILSEGAKDVDRKLLGFVPEEEMNRRRGWAIGLLILAAGGVVFAARKAWKKAKKRIDSGTGLAAGENVSRVRRFIGFCIAPAVLSLVVWQYYPLMRGLLISFQDYRIMKDPQWVGLDNFIAVATSFTFWKGLINSFLFVGLTLAIGFFLPFLLALALDEIPRLKLFFRTIFYLPAMTSGVVIAFLWKQFYDKTEFGLLNQLMSPVFGALNWAIDGINNLFGAQIGHFLPVHDWLGDPSLAMLAVVLPGIWAGAGPGSILYLAALKNVPDDRYEAADLDGATWIQKIRAITYPALKPLILINLLGAFVGGFKAMENIFVLTAGGPAYGTHTLALEVWQNAFMFLRFGYATAAAWVMGSILIGFTALQIRKLLEYRFTVAKSV
ncbi:MAG: extracellular solute-binding protein [Fimbriimonadales bacterium]